MYLEFVPDGHQDCPLLLISPAFPRETKELSSAEELYLMLLNLATDYITLLEIHGLTFISPIDGCRLTAEVAEKDFGVVLLENTKNHFTWKLTRQTWKEVLDYLFMFTRPNDEGHGHQWLNDTSDISVVISTVPRRW